MPDLHPGRGIPIGAVFLFEVKVLPSLVGSDAGCGVLVVIRRKDGPRGDALERRVLSALDEPLLPDVDPALLLQRAWYDSPRGLANLPSIPDALGELAERTAADGGESSSELWAGGDFAAQLGSIGGGNHFAEVSRVDKITDKPRARALGIAPDAPAILVHTGSQTAGIMPSPNQRSAA